MVLGRLLGVLRRGCFVFRLGQLRLTDGVNDHPKVGRSVEEAHDLLFRFCVVNAEHGIEEVATNIEAGTDLLAQPSHALVAHGLLLVARSSSLVTRRS